MGKVLVLGKKVEALAKRPRDGLEQKVGGSPECPLSYKDIAADALHVVFAVLAVSAERCEGAPAALDRSLCSEVAPDTICDPHRTTFVRQMLLSSQA